MQEILDERCIVHLIGQKALFQRVFID